MKKFLATLCACATVFTSSFIDSKTNAEGSGCVLFTGHSSVKEIRYQFIRWICRKHLMGNCDISELNLEDEVDSMIINSRGIPSANVTDANDQNYKISMFNPTRLDFFRVAITAGVMRPKVVVFICDCSDQNCIYDTANKMKILKDDDRGKDCRVVIVANNTNGVLPEFSNESGEKINFEADIILMQISSDKDEDMNKLLNCIIEQCKLYDQKIKNSGAINIFNTDTKRTFCYK